MGIKIKVNGKVEEVEFGELETQVAESWPSRDNLPTGDPIGDVVEEKPTIHRQGKNFDLGFEAVAKKECCESPDKYENIISNSLKFYSCRNCGADLGDIV